MESLNYFAFLEKEILYCNNLQMEWIRFGCEGETFLDLKDFFSFECLGPGKVRQDN